MQSPLYPFDAGIESVSGHAQGIDFVDESFDFRFCGKCPSFFL
jgi:hypothetical protein